MSRRLLTLLPLLGAASGVLAAGSDQYDPFPVIDRPPPVPVYQVTLLRDAELFSANVPTVRPEQLAEDIRGARRQLTTEQHNLEQLAERYQMNNRDIFLTAVMPGGLLYAAYKNQRYQQTLALQAATEGRMKDLSEDLLSINPVYQNTVVSHP